MPSHGIISPATLDDSAYHVMISIKILMVCHVALDALGLKPSTLICRKQVISSHMRYHQQELGWVAISVVASCTQLRKLTWLSFYSLALFALFMLFGFLFMLFGFFDISLKTTLTRPFTSQQSIAMLTSRLAFWCLLTWLSNAADIAEDGIQG